jgi:hypothetical protein
VHKHAARASTKRDVEVKTAREMKREEGEEFATESQVENLNVSRTLNFVFRQMNQEYISLLHLVDVRVAYVRTDRGDDDELHYTYREVTLSQLDGLLNHVVVPERREDVRRGILNVLAHVFDHEDVPHALVEEVQLKDDEGRPLPQGSYLRVPPRITSTFVDRTTGTTIEVPGVILAAMRNVMRTDGVVCDSFLGQGEALDTYSRGLQRETLESRQLENAVLRESLRQQRLALSLARDGDAAGVQRFTEIFPAARNGPSGGEPEGAANAGRPS